MDLFHLPAPLAGGLFVTSYGATDRISAEPRAPPATMREASASARWASVEAESSSTAQARSRRIARRSPQYIA